MPAAAAISSLVWPSSLSRAISRSRSSDSRASRIWNSSASWAANAGSGSLPTTSSMARKSAAGEGVPSARPVPPRFKLWSRLRWSIALPAVIRTSVRQRSSRFSSCGILPWVAAAKKVCIADSATSSSSAARRDAPRSLARASSMSRGKYALPERLGRGPIPELQHPDPGRHRSAGLHRHPRRVGVSIRRISLWLTVAHTWRYPEHHHKSWHVGQGRFKSPVIQDPTRAAPDPTPCPFRQTIAAARFARADGAGIRDAPLPGQVLAASGQRFTAISRWAIRADSLTSAPTTT